MALFRRNLARALRWSATWETLLAERLDPQPEVVPPFKFTVHTATGATTWEQIVRRRETA